MSDVNLMLLPHPRASRSGVGMTLFITAAPPPYGLTFISLKALGIRDGWGRVVRPRGEKSESGGALSHNSVREAPPQLVTCHFLYYHAQQWVSSFHTGGN